MAEEEKSVMDHKVEEPLTDLPKDKPEPKESKAGMVVAPEEFQETQKELEKTREALKKANKEAADRRKRLEELEAAEAKRNQDAMSETEKAQARIQQLETEKAQLEAKHREIERRDLQRKVAEAVGLPLALAERLRGDSEEDLTDDAKSMLELLPKKQEATPPEKHLPKLDATNPGNGKLGETLAQKKDRLKIGTRTNPFMAGDAESRGGGVVQVEKD
jgi:hypothetical protein